MPPYLVPSDSQSRIYIDWNRKFKKVSALDYEGGAFIGIIGVTAEGVATQVATPAGLLYPHEIQAMTVSSILSGESKSTPSPSAVRKPSPARTPSSAHSSIEQSVRVPIPAP